MHLVYMAGKCCQHDVPQGLQCLIMQLRTPSGIARRLLERAGVSHEGRALPDTCQADALLLVSGSQALRPVLSWIGALQVIT